MRTAIFATGLVLVACSWTYGQDVRSNYIPGIEFSKYHTYAWVNEVEAIPDFGGQIDQILDAQIKQAIDAEMATRGFAKAPAGTEPNLLLGYQAILSEGILLNASAWGGGWGGWGPWGGGLQTFSASSPSTHIGTFVLGIYDRAARKLVWIGAARGVIQPATTQEKHVRRLKNGAQKLLKDFPPRHVE